VTLRTIENVKLFRTDLRGIIVMTSDGSAITVATEHKNVSEKALWKPGKKTVSRKKG